MKWPKFVGDLTARAKSEQRFEKPSSGESSWSTLKNLSSPHHKQTISFVWTLTPFFFPSSLFDWHIPHRSTPSFGLLNTHISNTSSMKNISQLRGGAYHRVTWISKVLVLGWGAKEVQKSYESFLHFLLSWSDWSLSTYYDLRVEKCCHNWPVKFPFINLVSSTGQLLLQYPVLQTSSKNRSWKQYTEWCHFHFFPTNVFHIMNTMNMTHLRKGYLQSEGSSKQRSWKSYSNQGVSEH